MLLPFSRSNREIEFGNLGMVVEVALELSGSGGGSSEEPEVGAGTVVVLGVVVGLSASVVAPLLLGEWFLEIPPFSRISGEESLLSCSPGTAIKKCLAGRLHF